MKNLMWKLLRKHISVGQFVGFSLANLIGLGIVIVALQFYSDVRPVFDDEDGFLKKDYLVITRKVSGAGALLGGTAAFDAEAIADLKSQPWVRSVGEFSTSSYAIYASVNVGGGRAMRTQFFFESLPSEYIDVSQDRWNYTPGGEIPVIMSKDYLSLYNFGYATSVGMPQISEGMAEMIPLMFTLTGNGRSESFSGRIVGFSNRLNTVIVPEEFMRWSNAEYGDGTSPAPARLIVEVNSPGDVRIGEYMDGHRYEVSGDKANSSKANYFLTIVVGIVVAVGVLISALSFFVLMLSIYLLLQKNVKKLKDLLLLGYSPSEVAAPYVRLVVAVNAAVLVLSVALMLLARLYYLPMLRAMGVEGASLWLSIGVGVLLLSLITVGNVLAIRRKVRSLW